MKKATILMALVLLLSICGVGVLAADVFEERDQVVLTEKVICGDPAVADGLAIQLRTTYKDHLFWNTTLTYDEIPVSETEYAFSARPQYEEPQLINEGVRLDHFSFNSNVMEDTSETPNGLARAYRDLLEDTPPGGERKTEIRLKEYLDYYIFNVTLEFPEVQISYPDQYRLEWEEKPDPGTEVYAAKTIQEYFKIPVLEEERWNINVRKNEDGTLNGGGSGTTESDFYALYTVSVVTDDACYFTFHTRTAREKQVVDTSHLPEGYGIFCVPYYENRTDETGQKVCPVDADGLDMVYPLNPEIELVYLHTNVEQTKLLLHAIEDGKYILTVIDIATMETLQRLEIMDYPETFAGVNIDDEGSFICITMHGLEKLVVISVTENGDYSLDYICDTTPVIEEIPHHFRGFRRAVAYDGERLAIVRTVTYDESPYWDEKCNYYLFVYDRTGLLYCGEYSASLDTGNSYDNRYFYCLPRDHEPLAVSWGV